MSKKIAPPENQYTEWKEIWRDDYLRWACGFANSGGGLLVVGLPTPSHPPSHPPKSPPKSSLKFNL